VFGGEGRKRRHTLYGAYREPRSRPTLRDLASRIDCGDLSAAEAISGGGLLRWSSEEVDDLRVCKVDDASEESDERDMEREREALEDGS
jgi:hypothetical protein